MESEYLFDEESYANLAAVGIGWPDVVYVLRTGWPRLTRWRGGLLQIAAPDPAGNWMVVYLDARDEMRFWVRRARHVDGDEAENIREVLKMWNKEGQS